LSEPAINRGPPAPNKKAGVAAGFLVLLRSAYFICA